MLDRLRGADHRGIENLLVLHFPGDLVGFRNEPVHRGTFDSLRFLTKLLENLVEARDLIFGLFEMVAQAFCELAIGRLIDQLGKRLHDLALGVVHVLETMHQQVIHRFNVFCEQAHEAAPYLAGDA